LGVTVELHIEELALHGFAPGDHRAIAAGMQMELERLLAERGLPEALTSGADLPSIGGDSLDLAPGGRPQGVGAQIARSVFGMLNG
jgi:hypothetical protein